MGIQHRHWLLPIAAVLAAHFNAQAITTTGQYTVTILGQVQHNYVNSTISAFGINDNEQVAGYATVRVPDNFIRPVRGVIWQSSEPHDTILGTISENNGLDSAAFGINNSGVAVGESFERTSDGGGHYAPVIFTSTGVVDLGVKNASQGEAVAINNSGQVVGNLYYYFTPYFAIQAFLYQNGVMTQLGYPAPTSGYSQAYAINNNGLIVGSAEFPGDAAAHAAAYSNGAWVDLGSIGPSSSFTAYATSVNDSGAIVGNWQNWQTQSFGAFIYQDGQMSDLNAPYRAGNPYINNLGQIVLGNFIYQNGTWQDINNLDLGDGWNFSVAYGINNNGAIIGDMFRPVNGGTLYRSGLLNPVNPDQQPPKPASSN
jgi:probable HAF family extracellular repeat protein